MGPLEMTLAESKSLVPEDHIPRCCSAVVSVESTLGRYHPRSNPSPEELSPRLAAGSKGLGNRAHGSCAEYTRQRARHDPRRETLITLIWAS